MSIHCIKSNNYHKYEKGFHFLLQLANLVERYKALNYYSSTNLTGAALVNMGHAACGIITADVADLNETAVL